MDLKLIDDILASNAFPAYKSVAELVKLTADTVPAMAYWSVIHIVEGLMKQQDTLGEKKRYLNQLVVLCETIREQHKDHPSFGNVHKAIEDYANDIFLRANDEQELGVSYQAAIKLFLLSSAAYQVLITQSPSDDHEQTKKVIKLAKMKAVEAAKLFKQAASAPPPAPEPVDDNPKDEDSIPPAPKDDDFQDDFLFQPTPYEPPAEPKEFPQPTPRSNPVGKAAPAPIPTSMDLDFSKVSLGDSDRRKAELLTESALYALKADDVLSAATGLRQALQLLEKVASRQQSH